MATTARRVGLASIVCSSRMPLKRRTASCLESATAPESSASCRNREALRRKSASRRKQAAAGNRVARRQIQHGFRTVLSVQAGFKPHVSFHVDINVKNMRLLEPVLIDPDDALIATRVQRALLDQDLAS